MPLKVSSLEVDGDDILFFFSDCSEQFWELSSHKAVHNFEQDTRAEFPLLIAESFVPLSQPAKNQVQFQQIKSKFKTKARCVHGVFMEGKAPKQ